MLHLQYVELNYSGVCEIPRCLNISLTNKENHIFSCDTKWFDCDHTYSEQWLGYVYIFRTTFFYSHSEELIKDDRKNDTVVVYSLYSPSWTCNLQEMHFKFNWEKMFAWELLSAV